jgi:hypothetical protein
VVYRRSSRELVSVDVFTDGNAAVQALNAADAGSNDIDIETVLLGAESFEALKVTHGRYFVSAPADLRPVGH